MENYKISLSKNEWYIMQVLWESSPCTLRQICDALSKTKSWSKHSVISFLKRMQTKGTIRVEDTSPAKLYYPLLDRQSALLKETNSLLSMVYNGDLMLMLSYAIKQKELTTDEVDQLLLLLREGDIHD